MFDTLPNAQDLSRRARLRQLHTNTPPSALFQVRAWRWHHLALVRDLNLLQTNLSKHVHKLCPPQGTPDTRSQVLDSLNYILNDNWRIHDFVEHKLFHPWLHRRADPALRKTLRMFGEERARLAKDGQRVVKGVEKWVERDEGCRAGTKRIAGEVGRLKDGAKVLFDAEESVIIPWVVEKVSEKEQKRFNQQVLNRLSGRELRVSLVVFDSVLNGGERGRFEREVPKVVRWALPFWRRRFVGGRNRFIAG